MWDDLIRALCLMMVFEGILPFLSPGRFRQLVDVLAHTSDRSIRIMGLITMASGVLTLYLIR